ncbi:hypothetical protein K474DRAFT_1674996 [Panus rudis PR-1116 ss-1]|nr:hypothetical protein K474DRAFT_1674996 [Panus rudis PR-1116 ss-1]
MATLTGGTNLHFLFARRDHVPSELSAFGTLAPEWSLYSTTPVSRLAESQANSQGGSPADLRYADLGIERDSDHEAPAWAINLTHKMGRTWIPLFRKDPRNAARFLEKLRVVEDDKPPMQQFLLLIDSGLQNILFGILLDKRTFEAVVEDTPLMNRPQWFLAVIFRILLYLVQVAASPVTLSDDGQQYINAALDQLDMVFKVLWKQRDVLYQPLSPRRGDMLTEATVLRVAVGPVEIVNSVSQWFRLYKLSRCVCPESIVDIARRVSLARDTLAYAPHSRREAMEEVLRTTGPIRFVETVACRVLVEEVTFKLVDLKFVKVVAMISCVYIDSPQLAEVGIGDEGGSHTDVLRAMLVACQKQLCHGSQVHDEHGIALAVPLIGQLEAIAEARIGVITTLMEAHVSLIAKELGDNPHSRSIKRFKRTIRSICTFRRYIHSREDVQDASRYITALQDAREMIGKKEDTESSAVC